MKKITWMVLSRLFDIGTTLLHYGRGQELFPINRYFLEIGWLAFLIYQFVTGFILIFLIVNMDNKTQKIFFYLLVISSFFAGISNIGAYFYNY